jgi:predicted nucleic acid-binding protein
MHGGILLTDDLSAREMATDLGIAVHGSIGVVLFGYGRGRLSTQEAEELIRALEHDSTLYLAEPLIKYALQVLDTDYCGWG